MGLTMKRKVVKDDQSDPSERGCRRGSWWQAETHCFVIGSNRWNVNGMIVDVVCGSLGKTDQQIEQQTLGTRNHED